MSGMFAISKPHIPDIDLGFNDATLVAVTPIYIAGGQFGEGFTTSNEKGEKVNRFRWVFGLTDDDGSAMYDEGDSIEVDCLSGLQFFPTAKNLSKQTRIMKALLTPAEYALWVADEGSPTLDELIGRPVQVEVGQNDGGFLTVVSVIAAKSKRKRGAAAPEDAAE